MTIRVSSNGRPIKVYQNFRSFEKFVNRTKEKDITASYTAFDKEYQEHVKINGAVNFPALMRVLSSEQIIRIFNF